MKPYILSQTTWKYIKDAEISLAILPWGATEAHNYHLPYGTDTIESEILAAEAARIASEKGVKIIVLPAIPFGVNTGQKDIKLDINLNPSTQLLILNDIIDGLNRQGIRKLLVLNSHGGNDFKPILREMGLKYSEMFLACCNWFQSVDKKEFFTNPGDHADEMETSLMMHIAPEFVLPLAMAGGGKAKGNRIREFSEGWAWTERRWSQITEDTGVGDPSASTREKGEKYFQSVTEKLASLMVSMAETDMNELFE
jgi:creatinine amidohydrolase